MFHLLLSIKLGLVNYRHSVKSPTFIYSTDISHLQRVKQS